ncbi:MAG: dihydrolipoyl dehydrogenase family protein [Bacillota bacterium]|uniref:dihydrolipoyl dehydrogenase family protein n=1 Tax=unclassified Virgibacillus TaxID=2620237 RepID=UPI000EF4FBD0|nr:MULTISPECIES: FAD-dependent oxidoreductase [unclassified Virgibacillus]MCC2249582.1 FAD-dependent oxidoreductase [Virgibacillus sp. AGTR]QRZ19336.1 dihydrolipoyl dehydrogenase [Virgibacillus sp. AGTR]
MVVGEFAEHRELIIIGGGPGGYNAAIRAAQLGIQVTVIEQDQLGGTCLNRGCIPSKVFSHAAQQVASVADFQSFGICVGTPAVDFAQLISYKDQIIQRLRSGVENLCQANKVEIIRGRANFINDNRIGVELGHRFELFDFNQAIIATGSTAVMPSTIGENDRILVGHTVYELNEVPEELIVYGSDAYALEVACSFHKLGSAVSMVLDNKDFSFDHTINRELRRVLKKDKIKVYRGYQLEKVSSDSNYVQVGLLKNNQKEISLSGTHLYMATALQPATTSLELNRLGVKCSDHGFIQVDKQLRTSVPSIFAIGDVTGGTFSATKAMKQGKVAAEIIAGKPSEVDLTMMPTIVRSVPPIATVGLTEEEAKEQGFQVKTSQFSYSGNSYAMISNQKSGVAKVIKDNNSDLLLGVHTIGANAIELIGSGITALEMAGRDEDLRFPLYPHPSYNEILLEAMEGLSDSAIHMKPVESQLEKSK